MFYSTRSKITISFLGVAVLVCGISLIVGRQLFYKAVLDEAGSRVSSDLNAARELYLSRIIDIKTALNLTSIGPIFLSALEKHNDQALINRLSIVAQQTRLDFMGIVSKDGKTIYRIGPNSTPGDIDPTNPIADLALKKRIAISGTMILSNKFLFSENPELAERSRIQVPRTKMAPPGATNEELSGMTLAAAVPIIEAGTFYGVLYGGVLLNRSQDIVDRIRDTVFQHEMYRDRSIGTASIFLNNLRISTNVLNPDGSRAIGTIASEEVAQHVLNEGKKWVDRAFVANDWYISAYEPIDDIFGQRVGMLYVGRLEAKYTDVRSKAISMFILITVTGIAITAGFGYIIAIKISGPPTS